jgi:vancomycin permeability regulator SanA
LFLIGLLPLVIVALLLRGWTDLRARSKTYNVAADTPAANVAIVFGAGIRNGLPTAMLYDRVASAVDLYKAGRVRKLLMSGDNGTPAHNEPAVMRSTALRLGVPDNDIVLDYAGRSTYETCYRARAIFGVHSAVLVTQEFHLDRALLICETLGVQAVGFVADKRQYRGLRWNELREIAATFNAFIDLHFTKPLPVLGAPIVIG